MTPTELLEEAENEEEERIPLRKTKLKEHLKQFELCLEFVHDGQRRTIQMYLDILKLEQQPE